MSTVARSRFAKRSDTISSEIPQGGARRQHVGDATAAARCRPEDYRGGGAPALAAFAFAAPRSAFAAALAAAALR